VIRRDAEGDCAYTLLNAPANTPAPHLMAGSCQRYFTERTFEDAKTEIGWDEFQAQKYRAWEHHLALTGLALWFVAQTKLAWVQPFPAKAYAIENKWLIPSDFRKHKANRINNICILCRWQCGKF
jgi:SRSO17 transposase